MIPHAAVDAFDFYRSHPDPIGRNAAASIIGVLSAGESGLDPRSHGDQPTEHGGILNPAGSFGIAAWNGPTDKSLIGDPEHDRQAALKKFADGKGLPVDQVNTQLLFVLTECANAYPEVWAGIQADTPVDQLVSLIVRKYEVPAQPQPEIDRSLALARDLLTLPDPEPVPVPSPVPSPVPTLVDSELAAMATIVQALKSLDTNAQKRSLSWAYSRFVS